MHCICIGYVATIPIVHLCALLLPRKIGLSADSFKVLQHLRDIRHIFQQNAGHEIAEKLKQRIINIEEFNMFSIE